MTARELGRERRVIVAALFILLALGVVVALAAAFVPAWLEPGFPADPEAFLARFGDPDEETLSEEEPPTKSLVYKKAQVRAVYSFDARAKKWSFLAFQDPTSGQTLEPEEALKLLEANKRNSLWNRVRLR